MSDHSEDTTVDVEFVGGTSGAASLLAALMGGSGSRQPEPEATLAVAEKEAQLLQDYVERSRRPHGFRVGDLLQPRADSMFRRDGLPRIVVTVLTNPVYFNDKPSNPNSGLPHDLVLAHVAHGAVVTHVYSSLSFEPYVYPAAQDAESSAPEPTHEAGRA